MLIRPSQSRRALFLWLAVLATWLVGPSAEAQFGEGRRGGFSGRGGDRGGLFGTLRDEAVQTELKLTDAQKQQVETLSEASRPSRETFAQFGELRSLPEEEREARMTQIREQMEARRREAEAKLKDVLQPAQFARLQQLSLRGSGTRALVQDELAAELKLSEEQQTKIREVLDTRMQTADGRDYFRLSDEERQALRDARDAKVLALLSPEQKQAWEAKLGPPAVAQSGAPVATNAAPAGTPAVAPRVPPQTDGSTTVQADGTAAPQDVVSSFGTAGAEKAAGEKGAETLSFNFRYAPWADVLKLFADAAGLTLDLHDVPPGTFSYYDPNEYTPTEALDVLNGYLLPKGYILVRRNNFLMSLNIDNGIPPNLVPIVRPTELDQRGKNELLSVILPLGGLDPEQMAVEVAALLGPQGKAVPLKASGSLFVQDIGSNLRRISDLLSGLSAPVDGEALTFQSFPLEYVPAVDAERQVRSLFGLASATKNVSQASSYDRYRSSRDRDRDDDRRAPTPPPSSASKMHVAADTRMNALLVTATPTELKLVEEILKSVDVAENPARSQIASDSVPVLRVYEVHEADAGEVTKTLDAIMPGVVVNEDGRNDFIHILATPAEHREVEELIRRLDGTGSQSVDVIKLSKFDPVAMSNLLNGMYLKMDDDESPTIQAEPLTRTIIVRGTTDQIAQIRKTLLAYGEDGSGTGLAGQGGRFRTVPLGGRDPAQVARMVENILSGAKDFPNEIRVVVPSDAGPDVESRVPSSTQRESATDPREIRREEPQPQKSHRIRTDASPVAPTFIASLTSDAQDAAAETRAGVAGAKGASPVPRSSARHNTGARPKAAFAPATRNTSQPEFTAQVAADEANAAQASAPEPRRPIPGIEKIEPPPADDAPSDQRSPAEPRVNIEVRGGELFLYSPDEQALDRVESLVDELARQLPVQTTWTVFYLRSATAQDAAAMLEQLMPHSFIGTAGTGDGSLMDLGGQLADLTGLSSLGTGPQTLRIIPDVRTNSMFVTGPADKVRDVEQFLKIIDASETPDSLRDRVPRTIQVEHADVLQVAEMIREVYKDYMEDPLARMGGGDRDRDRNPFAMLMGGGGGSPGGGVLQQGIRLTLAVDAQTSQLIVSCEDALFHEIEQLVAERDQAAYASQPTVRIVTLNDANRALVQQALTSLSPKIIVSTTGDRTGTAARPATTSPSSSNGDRGRDSGDDRSKAIQDYFQQRMMERMRDGGGSDRGRSSGGDRSRGGSDRGRSGRDRD